MNMRAGDPRGPLLRAELRYLLLGGRFPLDLVEKGWTAHGFEAARTSPSSGWSCRATSDQLKMTPKKRPTNFVAYQHVHVFAPTAKRKQVWALRKGVSSLGHDFGPAAGAAGHAAGHYFWPDSYTGGDAGWP